MAHWRHKKGTDLNQGLRQCKVTLTITIAMHNEPSLTSIRVYGPRRECRICLTMEMSSWNGRDKHDLHTKCVIRTKDLGVLFVLCNVNIIILRLIDTQKFVHWTTHSAQCKFVTCSAVPQLIKLRLEGIHPVDFACGSLFKIEIKTRSSCVESVHALTQNSKRKTSVGSDTKSNYQALGLFLLRLISVTLLTDERTDFVP
jgi:hypothetical protein